MTEKYKVAFAGLHAVQQNIMKGKKPLYNPVALIGATKKERYRMIFGLFNKDFNSKHRGQYVDCAKEITTKIDDITELIILDNVQTIENDSSLQQTVRKLFENCLERDIQLVIGSDKDIDSLDIDELLKSKMKYGLTLYLEL